MGLENREGGNFISIFSGKFAQRVQEGTEGAVARVNKLGKTVHEKFYDNFTGKLVGIKTTDGAYGKQWVFSFKDALDVYHLNLAYSNSFATAFLKMLPNIDLTKEMLVSPAVKEVDGKQKSSLFVKQNDAWIKSAYTRENPNGMPDLKQITVKGQLVWDDTDRMVFLEAMVEKDIKPKLPKDVAPVNTTKAQESLEEFANDLKGGAEEEDQGF
jgi:hypothetical protein